MDIHCSDGKCPICDSLLIELDQYDGWDLSDKMFQCKNACYFIGNNNSYSVFRFFNKDPYISLFHDDSYFISYKATRDKIEQTIRYWKENDRYLIGIMAGE
ncbi:MAG: hypothetical protein K0R18_486 [Bacillales bacterium]|jgi:hypothetical protein|nr:hypothetical protein [Bacillales bacterium]